MKRIILAILLMLVGVFSAEAAPTVTVTATSTTILGSSQTISLTCTLIDPNQTGVLRSGGTVLTNFSTNTVTPGTTATCGPIWGNDVITDAFGNALTSYYLIGVSTVSNGIVASTPVVLQAYQFAGSGTFDLASTLPFSLGPVSPAGSVLGQNLTFAGNNTHSGTETFTGNLIPKILDNVQIVDSTLSRGGTDIGNEINLAYAALPSTGGEIWVAQKSDGSCYNFSVPILFTTQNKSVTLKGLAATSWGVSSQPGGACLNYTPTTATSAVTLDWNTATGSRSTGAGLRDITLINNQCNTVGGCGSSATAITIANVNGGASHSLFLGVHLQGWGTGFKNNANSTISWGYDFIKSFIDSSTTGADLGSGAEGVSFVDTRFVANGTHVTTTGGDTYFVNCSLDGHVTAGVNLNFSGNLGPSFAEFTNCHFENAASGSNTHFITGNGNWKIVGGTVVDDVVAGTPDYFFNAGGGFADANGLVISGSRTATGIIAAASPVRVNARIIYSGGVFASPTFTTVYANASDTSYNSNNSNAARRWLLEPQLSCGLGIGDAAFTVAASTCLHMQFSSTNFNGIRMTDTATSRSSAFGPGTLNTARWSLRDVTNSKELFGCDITGTGNCAFLPIDFTEIAAPAGAAGFDRCYGDSTAHALECSYNNGTFGVVPLLNRVQTWTAAQTHTGAAIIPDQTSGITGTTTNNNANAGAVGEYVQSVVVTGSSVALTTNVTANITSISLTAGDWDVTGAVDFTFGATTSYTNLIGSVSSTSATIGGQDSKFDFETPAAVPTAGADAVFPVPVVRFSLSGTTTVFLVAQGTFTASTLKAYGTIRARRIR